MFIVFLAVLHPKKKLLQGEGNTRFFQYGERCFWYILFFFFSFPFLVFIAFDKNSSDRKEFRMEIIFQPLPALDSFCKTFSNCQSFELSNGNSVSFFFFFSRHAFPFCSYSRLNFID